MQNRMSPSALFKHIVTIFQYTMSIHSLPEVIISSFFKDSGFCPLRLNRDHTTCTQVKNYVISWGCEIEKQKKQFERKIYMPSKCLRAIKMVSACTFSRKLWLELCQWCFFHVSVQPNKHNEIVCLRIFFHHNY